jgi:hypothetical protein
MFMPFGMCSIGMEHSITKETEGVDKQPPSTDIQLINLCVLFSVVMKCIYVSWFLSVTVSLYFIIL